MKYGNHIESRKQREMLGHRYRKGLGKKKEIFTVDGIMISDFGDPIVIVYADWYKEDWEFDYGAMA